MDTIRNGWDDAAPIAAARAENERRAVEAGAAHSHVVAYFQRSAAYAARQADRARAAALKAPRGVAYNPVAADAPRGAYSPAAATEDAGLAAAHPGRLPLQGGSADSGRLESYRPLRPAARPRFRCSPLFGLTSPRAAQAAAKRRRAVPKRAAARLARVRAALRAARPAGAIRRGADGRPLPPPPGDTIGAARLARAEAKRARRAGSPDAPALELAARAAELAAAPALAAARAAARAAGPISSADRARVKRADRRADERQAGERARMADRKQRARAAGLPAPREADDRPPAPRPAAPDALSAWHNGNRDARRAKEAAARAARPLFDTERTARVEEAAAIAAATAPDRRAADDRARAAEDKARAARRAETDRAVSARYGLPPR